MRIRILLAISAASSLRLDDADCVIPLGLAPSKVR